MRCTLARLRPLALASERVDQCVASGGTDSSVKAHTRSTSASLSLRGVPGRGSSSRPSSLFSKKRCRHLGVGPALISTPQHDPRSKRQGLRRLGPPSPTLQRSPFLIVETKTSAVLLRELQGHDTSIVTCAVMVDAVDGRVRPWHELSYAADSKSDRDNRASHKNFAKTTDGSRSNK